MAFLTTTLLVGDNDRISTLCRKVISLGGLASSFSNASSYRSFQDVTNTRSDREAKRLDMQSNGVNPASVSGKAADFGEPWEDGYRYVTADRIGETIHVSDQLSYKNEDKVIAPDSPDKAGPVAMPLTSRF
ncbi:hypothetical protein MTR72_05560 [Bradyrhizobium sp. ISRA442]|uniref:hypothetical protein n=1 Tax=Bradyrhizobium sp. ISRA442 TaxID=2866197 RepID=UPI00311AEE25